MQRIKKLRQISVDLPLVFHLLLCIFLESCCAELPKNFCIFWQAIYKAVPLLICLTTKIFQRPKKQQAPANPSTGRKGKNVFHFGVACSLFTSNCRTGGSSLSFFVWCLKLLLSFETSLYGIKEICQLHRVR